MAERALTPRERGLVAALEELDGELLFVAEPAHVVKIPCACGSIMEASGIPPNPYPRQCPRCVAKLALQRCDFCAAEPEVAHPVLVVSQCPDLSWREAMIECGLTAVAMCELCMRASAEWDAGARLDGVAAFREGERTRDRAIEAAMPGLRASIAAESERNYLSACNAHRALCEEKEAHRLDEERRQAYAAQNGHAEEAEIERLRALVPCYVCGLVGVDSNFNGFDVHNVCMKTPIDEFAGWTDGDVQAQAKKIEAKKTEHRARTSIERENRLRVVAGGLRF